MKNLDDSLHLEIEQTSWMLRKSENISEIRSNESLDLMKHNQSQNQKNVEAHSSNHMSRMY